MKPKFRIVRLNTQQFAVQRKVLWFWDFVKEYNYDGYIAYIITFDEVADALKYVHRIHSRNKRIKIASIIQEV